MSRGNSPETNHKFSSREQDVLRLLLLGHSNQQIAAELEIVEKTVEKHLTRIYEKAGCVREPRPLYGGLQKVGISLLEKATQ